MRFPTFDYLTTRKVYKQDTTVTACLYFNEYETEKLMFVFDDGIIDDDNLLYAKYYDGNDLKVVYHGTEAYKLLEKFRKQISRNW